MMPFEPAGGLPAALALRIVIAAVTLLAVRRNNVARHLALHVRQVDAGSRNGCELEIATIYIPGRPPRPQAILNGLLVAMGVGEARATL